MKRRDRWLVFMAIQLYLTAGATSTTNQPIVVTKTVTRTVNIPSYDSVPVYDNVPLYTDDFLETTKSPEISQTWTDNDALVSPISQTGPHSWRNITDTELTLLNFTTESVLDSEECFEDSTKSSQSSISATTSQSLGPIASNGADPAATLSSLDPTEIGGDPLPDNDTTTLSISAPITLQPFPTRKYSLNFDNDGHLRIGKKIKTSSTVSSASGNFSDLRTENQSESRTVETKVIPPQLTSRYPQSTTSQEITSVSLTPIYLENTLSELAPDLSETTLLSPVGESGSHLEQIPSVSHDFTNKQNVSSSTLPHTQVDYIGVPKHHITEKAITSLSTSHGQSLPQVPPSMDNDLIFKSEQTPSKLQGNIKSNESSALGSQITLDTSSKSSIGIPASSEHSEFSTSKKSTHHTPMNTTNGVKTATAKSRFESSSLKIKSSKVNSHKTSSLKTKSRHLRSNTQKGSKTSTANESGYVSETLALGSKTDPAVSRALNLSRLSPVVVSNNRTIPYKNSSPNYKSFTIIFLIILISSSLLL